MTDRRRTFAAWAVVLLPLPVLVALLWGTSELLPFVAAYVGTVALALVAGVLPSPLTALDGGERA